MFFFALSFKWLRVFTLERKEQEEVGCRFGLLSSQALGQPLVDITTLFPTCLSLECQALFHFSFKQVPRDLVVSLELFRLRDDSKGNCRKERSKERKKGDCQRRKRRRGNNRSSLYTYSLFSLSSSSLKSRPFLQQRSLKLFLICSHSP